MQYLATKLLSVYLVLLPTSFAQAETEKERDSRLQKECMVEDLKAIKILKEKYQEKSSEEINNIIGGMFVMSSDCLFWEAFNYCASMGNIECKRQIDLLRKHYVEGSYFELKPPVAEPKKRKRSKSK